MRILSLLIMTVSLLFGKGITEPKRSPMLWQYQEGDTHVSILGSIHFGKSEMYPLHPAIENAYEDASTLALEIDARKIPRSATFLEQYAYLKPEHELKDVLDPALLKRLREYLQQTSIPYDEIRNMRPWYLSINLADYMLGNLGLKAPLGIDNFFTWRAIKDQKGIFELEGFETQIMMMDSLSSEAEAALLASSLYSLEEARSFMDRMLEAWEYSDIPAFHLLTQESLGEEKGSQELYKIMFLQRNHSMAQTIDRLIQDGNRRLLVIIGAAHLVEKENVIELLNQKGYRFIKVP